MARFDVFAKKGEPFFLDCQTDLLDGIDTRLVVPLIPSEMMSHRVRRLNPTFVVDGFDVTMLTQSMAAVRIPLLGNKVASLQDEQDTIMDAIDMLLSGF